MNGKVPPPLRTSAPPAAPASVVGRFFADRTGLVGAAVTAAACVALSLLLWSPLTWPTTAIRSAIPAVSCASVPAGTAATACSIGVLALPLAAPLALAVVAFVFRKALAAAVEAVKRRVPSMGGLLAALLATVVFVLSWAGSHQGRTMEFGLLPQIVFPALVGLCTYATAQWGPLLHRVLAYYFVARDWLPAKVRMLLMMALPTLLSFWLAAGAGKSRVAFNEQVVVVFGILAGFFIVAPRIKPKEPEA